MKVCPRMGFATEDTRKAWHEKQNNLIKRKLATPEPSLLGSSVFSNNLSLNSLSELQGWNSSRGTCCRGKVSPSTILYENASPELSEEDRKILRLMALRREAAMREEEVAHSVRSMWAEEKRLREKSVEEKKKSWNEYVAQKRKMENAENSWRKRNQIDAMKREKMMLEEKIREKHERFEMRKREMSAGKGVRPEMESAVEEMVRREARKQQEMEEDVRNALKLKLCEEKCRRAEEKLRFILADKFRRIKEASLRRDVKWQAAKDARDEMKRKSEEMRKEKSKLEEESEAAREHRIASAVEWKRKMALEKNQMKREYHSFIYNKLKDEEREKESKARMLLLAKEARTKAFLEKKELAASRSRTNSRMAANLRQKIKSSFNF